MKLKISKKSIGLGRAIGIDEYDTEHIVIGGDLCYGEIKKVEPWRHDSSIFILTELNYEIDEAFSHFFDKDGLIQFDELTEVKPWSKPNKRIYKLEDYWVFPERMISHHVE